MADTNRLTRRAFLVGAAASGALVAAGCSSDGGGGESSGATTTTATTLPVPDLPGDPFTLGVASGDPLSDRVVLWTRLAPEPLAARGGMPRGLDVPVRWEVQTLAGREPVADGVTVAPADHGHTVHLDVDGLDPDTAYRYRFSVGEYRTRWARTRTLPAAGTTPDEFVLAQVSCSQYDGARFAAYRDVAEHEPDLVVHLGDYIYEHPGGGLRPGVVTAIELDDYRTQYALYRTDPNLRAAHAVAPWIITWDDHEVSNNYVGSTPDPDSESPDEAALLERRAAAYRAWWENQPVRLDPPDGPDLERSLEDRPIIFRPPSTLRRAQLFYRRHRSVLHIIAFFLAQFEQADLVVEFVLDRLDGVDALLQMLALAHQLLCLVRIVPQFRILGLGIEFLQARLGLVPVKDASSAARLTA